MKYMYESETVVTGLFLRTYDELVHLWNKIPLKNNGKANEVYDKRQI